MLYLLKFSLFVIPTHSGINDAEFLCGKAEDVLPKHFERSVGGRGEVVGVVDPPRGGLRKRSNTMK